MEVIIIARINKLRSLVTPCETPAPDPDEHDVIFLTRRHRGTECPYNPADKPFTIRYKPYRFNSSTGTSSVTGNMND